MDSLQWLSRAGVSAAVNLSLQVYIFVPFPFQCSHSSFSLQAPKDSLHSLISAESTTAILLYSLLEPSFRTNCRCLFECISNKHKLLWAQELLLRSTKRHFSSYQHHIFNIMSSNDMSPVLVHTEEDFIEVKTGTNKCDFCEKNRCVGKGKPARHMRRCNKCSRHVCEPCAEKRGWTHSLSWAR
ncbi:hypothetical protein BGX38DRAFT_9209 [Terfezia claveryi]|nr:hypothetical protein BGX38DRAFT_9209 [Terfezia claveryi]